jgi:hypothetical protein
MSFKPYTEKIKKKKTGIYFSSDPEPDPDPDPSSRKRILLIIEVLMNQTKNKILLVL